MVKNNDLLILDGPFGYYKHGTMGGLLNSLVRYYNIPLTRVESVQVGGNYLKYREKEVGIYIWFDGLLQPMIRFHGEFECYNDINQITTYSNEVNKVNFKLQLTPTAIPGLMIKPSIDTEDLRDYIENVMFTTHPETIEHRLTKEAGAIYKGYISERGSKYILIEFMDPAHATAWVEHLNENFYYS